MEIFKSTFYICNKTTTKVASCTFSGIRGWLPGRLAHNIIHNRTANTWGLPGKNIALDLLCEHSNNDFKGRLNDLEIFLIYIYIYIYFVNIVQYF